VFRDDLKRDPQYAKASDLVAQIENVLIALNSELEAIKLPDHPEGASDEIKAACNLLQALDLDLTSWKERITSHG
jgi:hypothetical protein